MINKEHELQDAQLKTIESIQEFLTDFHSVSEMYERTAHALAELMFYSKLMSPEANKKINDMVQDHICLLNRLTPLNMKGGEV